MGNISIRREVPFPPGLNTGYVTGCARMVVDSYIHKNRPDDMKLLGHFQWELSLSLVNNIEIQRINKQFRNIHEPTDVLSFPQYEPEELIELLSTPNPSNVIHPLGDVVISLEWVEEESKGDVDVIRRNFAWMITHGVLHLLGYDHEDPNDNGEMREEEGRMLLEMEDFISTVSS